MARKSTASKSKKAVDPIDGIIDATMTLIAEKGWHRTMLTDIAAASGVDMGEMRRLFGGKSDIIRQFIRRTDAGVFAEGGAFSDEDSHRDRLFDLLMRRFDALSRHKGALERLRRDLNTDPMALACFAPSAKQSMRWYLDAAGIGSSGPAGALRADGLLLVWLATTRAWFRDDSEDMAKTMAALDKNLGRAEKAACWLKGVGKGCGPFWCRVRRKSAANAEDAPSDAVGESAA